MSERYFSLVVDASQGQQDWYVSGLEAIRVGVADAKNLGGNAYLALTKPDDLQAQFDAAFPFWKGAKLVEKTLAPGAYYPRMARPSTIHPHDPAGFPAHGLYEAEIADTVGQLVSLTGRLRDICQVVQPVPKNMQVYGHSTREFLIIAATEVESHWKAVLKANGFSTPRMQTEHYVKTLPALKLDEYEISFLHYPGIPPVKPFAGWHSVQPTKSLAFYHAYNCTKHDRESEFHRATLEHAIAAAAACAVMAIAQFGELAILKRNRALGEFFSVRKAPTWPIGEHYTNTVPEWGWSPKEVSYPF